MRLHYRSQAVGLLCAVTVFLIDQISKYWILFGFRLPEKGSVAICPGLNFTMVWNHAITFGMFGGAGASGRIIFSVISLAIVTGLLTWIARTPRLLIAGLAGSITGGAVGNVLDRLHYGAVVDFIHAHAFGWSWYVFNIADAAIVCSVAGLILDSLYRERQHPSQEGDVRPVERSAGDK
ncbi:signal peptidase II [Acetobacter sp.]|jgi:signal peptidase II|uniref:signal peptidase II n=1 Tax=Acetobacter sp. TaxID=440 RepID=UPI0025C1469C|nr:signal peptidase II [Acetobacter sp.]MCH4090369.1 signal peptidase II [Acetobacter sp.]MCI1299063.1 signal peptidase II [Acetobacter sp.]MCI1315610.1 signal peptidase II [Acetobacter sp.]